MSKHTPGPWVAGKPSSVVGWPVVATSGRSICSITYVQKSKIDPTVPGDGAFNRESSANAHLIAAAPDMYKALKECADALHDIATGKGGWAWEEVLDTARAALAKAAGEQTEVSALMNHYSPGKPHRRLVYAWEGEVEGLRAETARLREALTMILANTEADAIPHIAYNGMTAYEALAKDIADCARAALRIAKD